MASSVPISGLKELAQACRELPLAVEKKVLRKAVALGAALIKDEAVRLAPVDTGTLQQAILIKRTGSNPLIATYIVAVRHGATGTVKKWGGTVNLDAYYWTFQEFGTSKMPAHPFMRPAFETQKDLALNIIIDTLAEGVELEAKALAWGKVA